jgi:hypothetical protein
MQGVEAMIGLSYPTDSVLVAEDRSAESVLPPRVTSVVDPEPPKHVGGILLYVRGVSTGPVDVFELRRLDRDRMT